MTVKHSSGLLLPGGRWLSPESGFLSFFCLRSQNFIFFGLRRLLDLIKPSPEIRSLLYRRGDCGTKGRTLWDLSHRSIRHWSPDRGSCKLYYLNTTKFHETNTMKRYVVIFDYFMVTCEYSYQFVFDCYHSR